LAKNRVSVAPDEKLRYPTLSSKAFRDSRGRLSGSIDHL
jgi:hypothetical protein